MMAHPNTTPSGAAAPLGVEHPSIAKFLITREAYLEAKDDEGRTALVWAIARVREDLVELLVRSGADRFAVDNSGRTVRQWSELAENPRIIRLVSSEKGWIGSAIKAVSGAREKLDRSSLNIAMYAGRYSARALPLEDTIRGDYLSTVK
ncbi:MAG: hypothetical protein M1813_001154 [Trichoglossum hirsutum]|nr:MAG: hypothetical protein M1813_001154 [Trichoglossum hirsutum]